MDDSLVESAFEDDGSDFDVPAKAPAKAVVGHPLRSDLDLLTSLEIEICSKESHSETKSTKGTKSTQNSCAQEACAIKTQYDGKAYSWQETRETRVR